jgi:hypothetical protein
LSRKFKGFRILQLVYQSIAQGARGSPCKDPRESGVFVCDLMQGFAVDSRDYGFWTSQKCGTNLNPASSKSERGSDTATICNATGSDNRDTYGIDDLREERNGANQACAIARGKGSTMPACLKTLGDDAIGAFRLQLSGFRNGRRRAQHNGPRLLHAL